MAALGPKEVRRIGAASMIVAIAALVALAVLPLGGAAQSDEVTVLVWADPFELEAYESVVDAFIATEPGFAVELVGMPDRSAMLTRLSTSIAAGNPPDAFLVNYRYFGQFAARDALAPIDDYLRESSAISENDFYPQAVEAFRWEGELMCLAQNVSSLVVYYNVDVFNAAQLPEPGGKWTWDDMVRSAGTLTRDLDGDGLADIHGLGVEPELIRLAPFVWSAGGELVDDPSNPGVISLDTPESRYALERFLSLGSSAEAAEQGTAGLSFVPTEAQVESESLESRFLGGRLAMYLSSRRPTPTFRTINEFKWDVAPLPIHNESANVLHSDGYCITAASDNQDRAWRFIEFALGPEGQRITAAAGRTVPSLQSVANSLAFLEPNKAPSRSQVFIDAIPTLRSVPRMANWPEIEDAANVILEQGFYEGLPIDEVVSLLESRTRSAAQSGP